jgi:DNA-binding beta-propeller fold protein YncE
MTKSKIFTLVLLAMTLCGCDDSSLGVRTLRDGFVAVFDCNTYYNHNDLKDCVTTLLAEFRSEQLLVPAASSDTAPYTIWVAEANSDTAMSKITLDPRDGTSTIAGVNVLPGVHAGGITSWLSDATLPQYGLYLWHDNGIEVLNPGTAAVMGGITIPFSGSGPILDFAISNDGTIGLAVVRNDTHLYVVDLVKQSISATIDLGSSAHPRASAITDNNGITNNNRTIYVTDSVNGNVYTTDLSGKTVGTIHVSGTPAELGKPAILPDGLQVWIPDVTHNSVSSIDVVSGRSFHLATPDLLDPREIQFSPDSKTAYILSSPPAGFGPGKLSIADTSNFAVSSTITLGNQPSGLALSPQGSFQFVANSGDGNVIVVQNGIFKTFPVGTTPVGVAAR